MTTTMMRTADQPVSLNPDWLPKKMPKWMTISKANQMFGYTDAKAIGDRVRRLHVEIRPHPYDRRKKQILMPQLLSRLDYDITSIEFTSGVDYKAPNT